MSIEATLTRAEREMPFQVACADDDPIIGPTRLALEIEDTGTAYELTERDPSTWGEVARTLIGKTAHKVLG